MACTYMREAALLYTFTTSEINYAKDPLKYLNLLNKRYCIFRELASNFIALFPSRLSLRKFWQIFLELNSKLRTVSKCRKRKKRSLC